MTFIPSVQTITDSNNSITTTTPVNSFVGSWTNVNGYESININIVCNQSSIPNGLQVQFSSDGTTVSKTVKDTFFININYSKTFDILDTYYKINFTTDSVATIKITSRLLVSTQSSVGQNNFYLSNDPIIDAFGKLRVSNPYTILDMKFPIQPPSQTSTTEYLNNFELVCTDASSVNYTQTTTGNGLRTISVNNQAAGTYKSQSRKYCNYQPGKSLLVLCSGVINAGVVAGLASQTNVSTRIGFFDDYNGFYFQYDSTNMSVAYKNNGTSVETITQSNWNLDTMNGSGTSSLNLDFTKNQLFVIDFEWLGVGRIRYGFYAFGKINYCHQILNINTLTGPYMQSANLPIRYELQGNGAGSTGALIQCCSTVISEGGFNPQGRPFTANNGLPAANNVTAVETPLLAIKGGGVNYYHQNIIPLGVELLNTANTTDAIIYRVRMFLSPSPDPGTFSWQNVSNYSVIQYAVNPTGVTLTGSIVLEEGYFTGRGASTFNSLTDVFSNVIQLTADATNISDIIIVTAQIQTGNAKVACSIQWQEVY